MVLAFFPGHLFILLLFRRAEPRDSWGQERTGQDAMQMSVRPGHNENLFNIKVNYF